MKKHFYSHLIEIDSLHIELEQMELSDEEKAHLIALVESNLHVQVLDAILSELSEEDKTTFLSLLAANDHTKIWEHLSSRIAHIEEKIKTAAQTLKNELNYDVRTAQKKGKKIDKRK